MRPDPNDLFQSYLFADWHEDYGNVLWWPQGVGQPPYCGTPLDLGRAVAVEIIDGGKTKRVGQVDIGGWPFIEAEEELLVWTILPGTIRWPK